MGSLSAPSQHELRGDLRLIQTAIRSSVSPGRTTMADTYHRLWITFCQQSLLDPDLSTSPDPVAWLQIFACRVRDGRLSASGRPVRSSTVADALQFVAQTFTLMGAPDPRLAPLSQHLDLRLSRLLRSYSREDSAPVRVKPIPISILHHASTMAAAAGDPLSLAASDLMWLAFFFLLRPGEYAFSAADSHPFRLSAISLWSHDVPVDPLTAPPALLHTCTFISLTFDTQKNGIRAEQIGHGHTTHPVACPVKCVVRRLLHLRSMPITPDTYLCAIAPVGTPLPATIITSLLRSASTAVGNPSGFLPSHVTARSLRASGATALLNRQVDANTIQLIGRWRSDSMLRYLHVQAHNVMHNFASIMLEGGDFNLIPTTPTTPLPPF